LADPITIPGYEAEQEEKKPQPIDRERPKKEGPAGFFRQHPIAKWILALLAVVLMAGAALIWHYYSARESTDDA